jgi:hypothetical protein
MTLADKRRRFLFGLAALTLPAILAAAKQSAQQDPTPRPRLHPEKPEDDTSPVPPGSRQAALEDNEKDIKKKVEKLFQLATELKEEVNKTDSAKVLSLAMIKKADEIERLAKDIKSRAKG